MEVSMRALQIFILLSMTAMLISCQGTNSTVIPPVQDNESGSPDYNITDPGGSNRALLGFWDISIAGDGQRVEVVPNRSVMMHFNVVIKLEEEPCTNCLSVQNLIWITPEIVQADFRLQHPFPGILKLTAFDVRGIFISGADFTFPVSGRTIAYNNTTPRMLVPDGYTSLFNPTEFPEDGPTFAILKYYSGKFSTGGDLSSTLNPFVAYGQANPRRLFEAGSTESRTVRVHFPAAPIQFGYAVDASWVLVDEVIDPVEDFPPEANCHEAYRVVLNNGEPVSIDAHGAGLNIEVFDHQGLDTISTVTVEAPDFFDGQVTADYLQQMSEDSWLFSALLYAANPVPPGTYPLLVRITDVNEDPNLGAIDAWYVADVNVGGTQQDGWARTWGGVLTNSSMSIDTGSTADIFVSGNYEVGLAVDAEVRRYKPYGALVWECTWGSSGKDFGLGVCVDNSSNIWVTGHFQGTVDFDPGPGEELHTAVDDYGAYLSKFDFVGNFQYALTWGGAESYGVKCDGAGNLYLGGSFYGTVDFDPGPGVCELTAIGSNDSYLTKFNSNGEHVWAVRWGSLGSSLEDNVWALDINELGDLYATGKFTGTTDFDPGPGVDEHTSNHNLDAFSTKFDLDGNHQWAVTWGGQDYDRAVGLATDNMGNVIVTGRFPGDNVDFDPGPGTDNHSAAGSSDIFVTKFNFAGEFQWAHTWGGIALELEHGHRVAVDSTANIYVTGMYYGDGVDFDPGPGMDERTSNGDFDIFLVKFDPDGNYMMARTWGGPDYDAGQGVTIDPMGNIIMGGHFQEFVNFAPSYDPCYEPEDWHASNGSSDSFLIKFLPDGCW